MTATSDIVVVQKSHQETIDQRGVQRAGAQAGAKNGGFLRSSNFLYRGFADRASRRLVGPDSAAQRIQQTALGLVHNILWEQGIIQSKGIAGKLMGNTGPIGEVDV